MTDRAGVAATTIIAIVGDALRAWLRGSPSNLKSEIEVLLRHEFADVARNARTECEPADD